MTNDVSQFTALSVAASRSLGGIPTARRRPSLFNSRIFLEQAGEGKTTLQCQKQQILFAQGDEANAVFYIVQGLVKLTVISPQGKEAVVAILDSGEFFGEA